MSAEVIAYSASDWDTSLALKVECRECEIEWGWSVDRKGMTEQLQSMAESHNSECHVPTRVEYFGRLQVHQPVKETPVSDCTACEHPVTIPEHLKATVTEIHTCEGEAA